MNSDTAAAYNARLFSCKEESPVTHHTVMIAKALGQSIEAITATGFADDQDISEWAKGAVAAMKKLGLVEGKSANAFAPGDKTTRAEAVTVLLKMLGTRASK